MDKEKQNNLEKTAEKNDDAPKGISQERWDLLKYHETHKEQYRGWNKGRPRPFCGLSGPYYRRQNQLFK